MTLELSVLEWVALGAGASLALFMLTGMWMATACTCPARPT